MMFSVSNNSAKWKGGVLADVKKGSFTIKDSNGNVIGTYATQDVIDEANRQKAAWREQALGKKFNHYIRLGATFSY